VRRLLPLLALVAGCGSFENDRFSRGEGRVLGLTSPDAEVWLVGRPDLATRADGAGRFELAEVPAGGHRLVVSIAKGAAVTAVQVVAHAAADVGRVQLSRPVTASGYAPPGSLVFVPGTGLVDRAGADGRYVLPGLPVGCLPLAVQGADPAELCLAEDTRVDLRGPESACLSHLGCPVAMPCTGGSCQAPECVAEHACPSGWLCDAGACVRDCACGPDLGCERGLVCVDDCLCVEPDCDPEGVELCNGLDDDCDGQIDEGLGLGEPCGPVARCGPGRLACTPDGDVFCPTAPEVRECRGFGPIVALTHIAFSPHFGFDLDDADGDGDPLTGIDNLLSRIGGLTELIAYDMWQALDLPDGRRASYLVELAGLRPDGNRWPDAGLSLRVYLGAEVPDDPGRYDIVWSLLGDHGLPLGDLPLLYQGLGTALAGPAPVTLQVAHGGQRRPLPLSGAYMAVSGLHTPVPGQTVSGELGGAVALDVVIASVTDPDLRLWLKRLLTPGDVDTDGDGTGDALSLGLAFHARRVGLRVGLGL